MGKTGNGFVVKVSNNSALYPAHQKYKGTASKRTSKNFKQIFLLSYDALKDRKARSRPYDFDGHCRKCLDGCT